MAHANSETLSDDPPDIDAALIACARGDQAALRAIYRAEAPRMLGVAMRLVRRRALAEEVLHDAFVAIWSRAASFDPARGSAKSWIYAVLRNRALNILRAEAKTEYVDDVTVLDVESDEEGPEDVVARLSDGQRLKHCLEQLPRPLREGVVLAYVRGLTHGELAGRLGLPLGTLKSRLRRSLVTLKDCMG